MAIYKYLDLNGLASYHGKVKNWVQGKLDTLEQKLTIDDIATIRENAGKGKTAYDAWTVFLAGFPTADVKPTLSQLATTESLNNAITGLKNGASAGYDTFKGLEDKIKEVDGSVKQIAVTASGDSYVEASAKGYAVTVKASDSTIASLGKADSAVQSVKVLGETLTDGGELTIDEAKIALGLGTAAYTSADSYDAKGTATGLVNGLRTELIGDKDTAESSDNTIEGVKLYAYETSSDLQGELRDELLGSDDDDDTNYTIHGTRAYADSLHSELLGADDDDDTKYTIHGTRAYASLLHSELIGHDSDDEDAETIYGAKAYAKSLNDELAKTVDNIVAGGVSFIGVLESLPETPVNGQLFVAAKDFTAGGKTYKEDFEYIYDAPEGTEVGVWHELGNADKNAKEITDLKDELHEHSDRVTSLTNLEGTFEDGTVGLTLSYEKEIFDNETLLYTTATDSVDVEFIIPPATTDLGLIRVGYDSDQNKQAVQLTDDAFAYVSIPTISTTDLETELNWD